MEMSSSGAAAQDRQIEFSLPPTDGGRGAWSFLAACFFVEAFVFGFPFSYGIFEHYYSTHEPFASRPSGIPVIGTTALGTLFIASPFVFMVLQRWPNHRRNSCVIGIALMSIGLLAASFATAVPQLIVTQGVIYAVGGVLIYYPTLLFLDEWFVRKKGFAFGTLWAGTGAGGLVVPFLTSFALSHFSFRITLRAWSIAFGVCLGALMVFIKPRLPVTLSSTEAARRRFDYSFVLTPSFLVLQAGNIFQSLGFFNPGIYLPTYASSLGMSSAVSTVTIALLNVMTVFGCIGVGLLIDRLHVTTVLIILTLGSIVSVFVLWGLAADAPTLLVFSAVFGLFAGPFTTTYTGIVREVKRQAPSAEVGLILGLLCAGRGIGSVVSGPISQALLGVESHGASDHGGKVGYDTGYGPLIIFTGASVALGGVGFGARRLGWL